MIKPLKVHNGGWRSGASVGRAHFIVERESQPALATKQKFAEGIRLSANENRAARATTVAVGHTEGPLAVAEKEALNRVFFWT